MCKKLKVYRKEKIMLARKIIYNKSEKFIMLTKNAY
jgi:hypothetical protein